MNNGTDEKGTVMAHIGMWGLKEVEGTLVDWRCQAQGVWRPGRSRPEASRTLTFMGAEAILAVLVKVVRGGAPEEAIGAACVRAAGILLPVEQERELAILAVSIPILHTDH